MFPRAIIHAFEPSPSTFAKLETAVSTDRNVVLNNCGVGAQDGTLEFSENRNSDMSSFLPLGPEAWSEVQGKIAVPVVTVDGYCGENALSRIDVLKIDTQGFDFEVLKGADRMLSNAQIRLVFMEVTFRAPSRRRTLWTAPTFAAPASKHRWTAESGPWRAGYMCLPRRVVGWSFRQSTADSVLLWSLGSLAFGHDEKTRSMKFAIFNR
jgi:FkbM family methyltransferase